VVAFCALLLDGKKMNDCIVVGAGVSGMLSAYALLQRGVRCTIVERGLVGREASWAGGGILSPLYPWNYPDPVNVLARWSQRHYPALLDDLHQATGIDPQWQPSGLLVLEPGEQQQIAVWGARFETEVQWLSAKQALQIEPSLSAVKGDVAWLPQVGQVRNPRLLKALRAYLTQQGVTFLENQPVTAMVVEQGRIQGVRTEQGLLQAEKVVVASGAWSAQLLADLGKPLPVRPVRGQMILFRAEPEVLKRIVLQGRRYLIPRRDGRVVVGSTLEEVGFDKSTTDEALRELKAFALERVPALAHYPIEHHWSGLRPAHDDGVPLIGAYPEVEGLFVNAGHFRNGIVMGLASAELLAALLTGQEPPLEPEPYRLV